MSKPVASRKRPRDKQSKAVTQIPRSLSSIQNFDHDTGQVYSETEVVFRKKQSSDWIGEFRSPELVTKQRPSEAGARSLLEIATRKCVKEIRNLTPHHFEGLPWSLVSKIWAEIISTRSESFHAWRTLATAYNDANEFGRSENRYLLDIRSPPLPVQEYFRGINSSEANWLSALRISPKQIAIPDLIAVANITNLTILDLSDGQMLFDAEPSRFDERIMRTWAELASSRRGFKHLRVLLFGWQDNITEWIFKYLKYFPALQFLVVTDCKYMHQKNRADWEGVASSYNWTALHAKRSVKRLRPLLEDKEFHIASVSSIYYESLKYANEERDIDINREFDSLPVIECWIGTPRRWNHIIDEFPGLRTIWFEKTKTTPDGSTNIVSSLPVENGFVRRSRERGTSPIVMPSPPRRTSQEVKKHRPRATKQTAASLLADMGM